MPMEQYLTEQMKNVALCVLALMLLVILNVIHCQSNISDEYV
jgi:hypothetical protein